MYTGRFGRTADVGEDGPVVSDRHRVCRLLVRATRSTGNLSQGTVDGRLDIVRDQFGATINNKYLLQS